MTIDSKKVLAHLTATLADSEQAALNDRRDFVTAIGGDPDHLKIKPSSVIIINSVIGEAMPKTCPIPEFLKFSPVIPPEQVFAVDADKFNHSDWE